MKKAFVVLLIALFGLIALDAGNVKGDTYTTVYNYYRAPDPDWRAYLKFETRMNAQVGVEGGYMPNYSSGWEPSILQKGYDEANRWDWGWPPSPSPWAIMTSERVFESQGNLAFGWNYGAFCHLPPCGFSPPPYPAQNPVVRLSGKAQPGNLRVGGQTFAGATGKRMPPVAQAKVTAGINNSFTVLPGSSSKGIGDPAQVSLKFRLYGTLSAENIAGNGSHALMSVGLSVTNGSDTLAVLDGYANLHNNYQGQSSAYSNLAYSTNSGIDVNLDLSATPDSCIYDTGLLDLTFDAVVGTTYGVGLSLFLQSDTSGSADESGLSLAPSRTRFMNPVLLSFSGNDGVALAWETHQKPVPVDMNADGRTDIAIYRGGDWYIRPSDESEVVDLRWGGNLTDIPALGDYDGDGKTDVAVYEKANGAWWIIPSSTEIPYGVGFGGGATDLPVPGDYDGDGKTDIAIYRQEWGAWFITPSAGGEVIGLGWGGDATDIPVPGDYDGDGITDVAIYRAENGSWWIRPSSTGIYYGVGFGGGATDLPVPGDYDGDGKTDIAVYRQEWGAWFITPSGGGDVIGIGWGGNSTDIPVPADYDGDGKTDVAIYRAENGAWWIIPSSTGTPYGVGFGGGASDIPITQNIASLLMN
jgi:hypothetical protein